MPQLVFLAAVGAGLYAGSRLLGFLASQMQSRAEASASQPTPTTDVPAKDLGALEYDPQAGVYKPAKQH